MTVTETKPRTAGTAPRGRYDGVMMTLHWLVALAVLTNIGLGLYMGDLPRSDPMKFAIVQLHKSIGLTVLVLSVAIILWRLSHRAPSLPQAMAPVLKLLARATQVLLYVLIFVLPLTGWFMVSSSPRGGALSWFGVFDWPLVGFLSGMAQSDKKIWVHNFAETHETLAWIMIGLAALHILGALWHQFVARDGVMKEMLPGPKGG